MPFSRISFHPDPGVEEMARAYADEAIKAARDDFGVALDWTEQSVRGVDAVLDQLRASRPSDAAAGTLSRRFGSYVGEVFRRSRGGEWGLGEVDDQTAPAVRLGATKDAVTFWPWSRARERITTGSGQSMWDYYRVTCQAADEKSPQTEAADEDPWGGWREEWEDSGGGEASVGPREFYMLGHDNDDFDAGTAGNGRQVLMGFFFDGLRALFFDGDGNLVDVQVRPLPMEPPRHQPSGVAYESPEFRAAVERATQAWKSDMGFHPEPIRVRKFSVPGTALRIEDLPETYEEFLKAPELDTPDPEERREAFEFVREWQRAGRFVLYWGNDLWVDADGTVQSS